MERSPLACCLSLQREVSDLFNRFLLKGKLYMVESKELLILLDQRILRLP